MKRYIFTIALCLKLETYCVGDDLLSGYANIFSTINISSLTVNVNPSIEANQIKDKYEYLVFVFMNGVNDLGILNFSISDINEMEMVGSTDKVAVVVEHNRIEKTRSGLKFGSGANTYFIKKDPNNSRDIISQIISYTPDGDMGSARHFAISAHKVIKRFKPQKLIIIVWNHGNGYFGISHDDVSGNSMSVKDLGYALSQIKKAYGKKIDIFAMDACLMQMAEVISEIKDYARFVVASEELVPGAGYPYDDILNNINFSSSVDDAAKKIVDAFYAAYSSNKMSPFGRYFDKSITLSVIDTSSYSQFISLLNRWVSRAIKSSDFKIITSTEIKENIFFFLEGENSETFEIGPYMSSETEGVMTRSADLVDYLKTALSKMTDDVLKNYTENLINFITKKLVLYHKACDYQNSKGFSYKDRTYGIAIYLPKLRYNSSKYEGLKFSKDSLWNEFLKGDLSDEFININLDDRILLQNDLNNFSNVSSTYADSNINGTKIKIEIDKSIIDKFSNNLDLKTYTSISENSISGGKNNINDNKNNQGKRDSSAANIYSISYTHKKTVIPKEENLISAKKSDFEINSQKESFDNKQKEEKSFSNLFIEKSKNIFLATLAKIGYGTDKVKGLVFDDKEEKKEVFLLFDKFENEISNNLSVEFSRQLIINTNLQNEFLKIDKNRASKIIAYANSIIEIDEILSKDYSENDVNILSSYLSSTLDRSRQICELKICVPPENLIDMMRKNQKYDQAKINFTQYAIRSWEYVFSNEAFIFNWAQARNVVVSSTSWLNMSVKERNVALEYIVKESLIMGTSTHNQILFTPNILRQVEKRQELSRAVINVSSALVNSGFLTAEEFKALSKKPLEEQAYILANFFDRSGIKNNLELKKDIAIINANRTSFTTEVIDQKNRAILANYISNNAFIELSNSKKATELYKNLFKDKKPVISIEYIDKDSYNDGRKITINASLIEQYLRIRGYNTDSLKNENVKKDVLAYISPLIVKEMASIYVSSKSNGYMPEVREKYAISLLYQAEYFKENYNRMNEIFSSFYGYNDYADKIDAINRIYRTSDSKYDFIQKVGIRYYSNLPSSNIARSEILNAVSKEIEKRAKLSVEDRKKIDKYAIFNENDIKRLTPLEISAHVETFTTSALLKIQQILINKNNFASIYDKIISSF